MVSMLQNKWNNLYNLKSLPYINLLRHITITSSTLHHHLYTLISHTPSLPSPFFSLFLLLSHTTSLPSPFFSPLPPSLPHLHPLHQINVDEYDDVDEVCNEKDLITEVCGFVIGCLLLLFHWLFLLLCDWSVGKRIFY